MTEQPWPDADYAPGAIEVRRSTGTNESLLVFYSVSGSATPGEDYKTLPGSIEIPAGQSAAYIKVDAIDDKLAEGDETVVLHLIQPPFETAQTLDPAGPALRLTYVIDPEHDTAAITILDNDEVQNQVVLSLETLDASATEPGSNTALDPAVFILRRVGGPNVAVTANLHFTGSALNGVDYQEVKSFVDLPADQDSAQIVIKPLADNLIEGDEVVEAELLPPICPAIYPPLPSCYLIGAHHSGRAVIHDAVSGGNHPPRVVIVRPEDGSAFRIGAPINIRVEASDADGTVTSISLFADNELLRSAPSSTLDYSWSNAPAGPHTLSALAVDNLGTNGVSKPVRILVKPLGQGVFVRRNLPGGYVPGVAFRVELKADPPAGTDAYAVEDHPPTNWTVSEISHEGVFDPVTGKVKFGPFFDHEPRTLAYMVTPPDDASGPRHFEGDSSANGAVYPILGDSIIGSVGRYHPADTNQDSSMVLAELTAYAAAWKQGDAWPTGPSPIPMDYVTRAAMLWRQGEAYVFDPSLGAPPLCWIPATQAPGAVHTLEAASSERNASGAVQPGAPLAIAISITPPAGITSYAVEERIPPGWSVSEINNDGVYDAEASSIRWGLFLDSKARVFSYTVTPPATIASIGQFGGSVSFDGKNFSIDGSNRFIATASGSAVHLDKCERRADGSVELQLSGAVGQPGVLESSTDLVNWTEVKSIFLPDGTMTFTDSPDEAGTCRYYRLRIP
jgi:hypothetical protein